MSRDALVEAFFNEFFSLVNDQWVRGELAKQQTGVAIYAWELHDAILDSYVAAFEAKNKRFTKGNTTPGETEWPSPSDLATKRDAFNKATMVAMDAAKHYARSKRYIFDPQATEDTLAFWTNSLDRNFFRLIKTEALKVLEAEMKVLNENARVSTVKSLMEEQNFEKPEAKRANEDWQIRRGIQITHQGFTTTGAALGAVALQAVEDLLAKNNIRKVDISQYFGEIVGTYETSKVGDYFRIALKEGAKVNIRAGSFVINSKKEEAGDLSKYKEHFISTMKNMVADLSDKDIEALFGSSPEQITRNVGAIVTQSIAEQLTGRQITQRTDLIKWAKARGVTVPRTIGKAKYLNSPKSKKKAPIISNKREEEAFKNLASVRAQQLHLILQQKLLGAVISNMGHNTAPSRTGPLVYRSGTLAESIRIPSVAVGADGLPVVRYDYDKYPYQVFEPGHRLGKLNENWDPYKLINKSVRQIAKEIEITKLRIPRTGELEYDG